MRQTDLALLIPPKLRSKGRFQSIGKLGQWGAKLGMAKASLRHKRVDEGVAAALDSVGLYYHNPLAHYILGLGLAGTGWIPLPSACGWVKPSTPCLSAVLPMVIEVRMIGDRGGSRLARLPMAPCSIMAFSVGILPWSIRGWIAFQSAASQPTRRTLRVGAGRESVMLSSS